MGPANAQRVRHRKYQRRAWLQQPREQSKSRIEILDIFDHARTDEQIGVGEAGLIDVGQRSLEEPHRIEVALLPLLFAEGDHLRRSVDADHPTAQGRQLEAENSTAAAHVQGKAAWRHMARQKIIPNLESLLEFTRVLIVRVKLSRVVRKEIDRAVGFAI